MPWPASGSSTTDQQRPDRADHRPPLFHRLPPLGSPRRREAESAAHRSSFRQPKHGWLSSCRYQPRPGRAANRVSSQPDFLMACRPSPCPLFGAAAARSRPTDAARSPAPPRTILEEFFHFFLGVPLRCRGPLPVAVGPVERGWPFSIPPAGVVTGDGGSSATLACSIGSSALRPGRARCTLRVYVASLPPKRGRSLHPSFDLCREWLCRLVTAAYGLLRRIEDAIRSAAAIIPDKAARSAPAIW
jgi:hypothetical protein